MVVLDTGPVRELAHSPRAPHWVSSFSAMKAHGYQFSLADHACGELINQRSRGSINDRDFGAMIDCLETFLDPAMPVMLGTKDIRVMIGAATQENNKPDASDVSRQAWSMLRECEISSDDLIEHVLHEDRAMWSDLFRKTEALYAAREHAGELDEYSHPLLSRVLESFNADANTVPPLSTRYDLQLRYFWRQFVRSKKEREPYNADAPKKRNDGIDFGLYGYLALPALIVATERGFFERIADIPSFQKAWIQRPEDLASSWAGGHQPQPTWPD
ncbi:hypothetical protein [Bradyrhizobium sp. LA6.12]|uniref:hypothetical protein n=1 Tax=unclassified Bradyrhizobium TaxID=2631580 RepID=UPI003398BA92